LLAQALDLRLRGLLDLCGLGRARFLEASGVPVGGRPHFRGLGSGLLAHALRVGLSPGDHLVRLDRRALAEVLSIGCGAPEDVLCAPAAAGGLLGRLRGGSLSLRRRRCPCPDLWAVAR
jgi:hypothetical protein